MKRIDAIKKLSYELTDELVVCNIGFPSREMHHVKDSPNQFYMMGSMGLASSIGLGVAMSTTKRVVVIDGDGSVLMNMGSMVTVYNQNPKNLVWVVLDNECYGSTGSQCTYASSFELGDVARSIGFKNVFSFDLNSEFDFSKVLGSEGPVFVHLKVEPGNADVPVIPMEPEEIMDRFIQTIRE
ncbi:MAG: sulfopyruvate decarboxylase subunit beta [Methanobacterium sp. ERen5]|nr:MAG: sulfopyruvate decarboxylase subunit beta [Methanobacterium sp. ERen5]